MFDGATGRSAERDRDRLGARNRQQRIDQRGLTDAGSTGDYKDFGGQSDADSLSLAAGERQLWSPLDPRDRLIRINRGPRRFSDRKCREFFGDLLLSSVEASEKDTTAAVEVIGDDRSGPELQVQRLFDEFGRHFEQFCGGRDQRLCREPAMPLVHRFSEGKGDAGAHADRRGLFDAELGRDLVSGAKADAADVASQAIGFSEMRWTASAP